VEDDRPDKDNDLSEDKPWSPVRHVHEEMASDASRTLAQRRNNATRIRTDERYANVLAVRSHPLSTFLTNGPALSVLPVSSINEDKLLRELGLSDSERYLIEGFQAGQGVLGRTEKSSSKAALVRLAADPSPQVHAMQRRSLRWLFRPYPLGMRFSGNNMSPLPGWLSGAQSVALNMCNVDLPVQLHFALFNASAGFILKPPEMRTADDGDDDLEEVSWPPPRAQLVCTTVDILSLHKLPKRGERRPSFDGRCGEAHKYHPELSGTPAPPSLEAPSSPAITLALHPIGGFCALSHKLPLLPGAETELITDAVVCNGLNSSFNAEVHCVSAEPHTTFLRASVIDRGYEVAYETCVLGRMRHGYRVLLLRSDLGTRIECCYLLVRIRCTRKPSESLWARNSFAARWRIPNQQPQPQIGFVRQGSFEVLASQQHS